MEQRTSKSAASSVALTSSVFDHPISVPGYRVQSRTPNSCASTSPSRPQEGWNILSELAATLDYEARSKALGTNLTADNTTLTAGLGWVDNRPDRQIEKFVLMANNLYVVDKGSTTAMMERARPIFFPGLWTAWQKNPNGSWTTRMDVMREMARRTGPRKRCMLPATTFHGVSRFCKGG